MTIPVTILTGFLGAGKTTLLNRIITADTGKRIAVVVNELGDIGIDDKYIVRREGDIIELTNGCICCGARDDTANTLLALAARAGRGEALEHVVIETTGFAKPASLCRFFFADSSLKTHYRLKSVVTVVDAYHGTSQLVQFQEAKEQVAVADCIVLNKTDLVEELQLRNLEEWLGGINPIAPIVRSHRGEVALDLILNSETGSVPNISENDSGHNHVHDRDITAICIHEELPLNRSRFLAWLAEYVAMHGGDLLRYKGILYFFGSDRRIFLQGVHMINELEDGGPWPADATPTTELVFIGRRLSEDDIRKGVRTCLIR